MQSFRVDKNKYLDQDIQAFYHADYVGYQRPGNPDFVNVLKNTFGTAPEAELTAAAAELRAVLLQDLPQILQGSHFDQLTACAVPRAKAEDKYIPAQLLFRTTVQNVVGQLPGFNDGTELIIRHTDTKTTHLRGRIQNNNGADPYPGITSDTCVISDMVRDKDILLIDDIYTKTINIDEDAIQALMDSSARSVTFYAVGRTFSR